MGIYSSSVWSSGDSPPIAFQSSNRGNGDSFSHFFIASNPFAVNSSTFLLSLVPTLRTPETANEKSRETTVRPLDAISTLLFETRPNSFMLPSSRFANGIGFYAISFTTISIWQIMGLSVQCDAEIKFMAPNTQPYPTLYLSNGEKCYKNA